MPADAADDVLLSSRYRLLDVVGEGGMAVVWRAEDLLLGRAVAVKVLRPQYASDPDFLQRLHSEARAAAALNDPGVVGVYDVGEDAGRHYIVMEFVPGRDLKAIIREDGPLEPARSVALCVQIARAVGRAHETGLVHRDVKPQNVLVTPDGRPKVADFGIARAMTAAGTTAPGVVMGTVQYLAPEVAAGGPATPAADVYGLGVVLYEMLTGRLPFEADSTMGVVMKIMNDAPEPVCMLNPRVPAVLGAIVERAMARDPERRYADASGLAEALAAFERWSDQATGGVVLPQGAEQAGPPPAAAGTRPRRVPAPASRPARVQHGPTLDLWGLLLALVALAAVAGLLPLWNAVRQRYQTTDAPIGFLRRSQAVLVASGPAPTQTAAIVYASVPDVVGREAESAAQALSGAGLAVSTEIETSGTVPEGRVIRQRPQPDAVVPSGTVVELVVSGQAPLTVPSLSGTWASVSQSLEAMGFVPRRRDAWGGDPNTVDQVIALDPPPGSRWPRGAPVDVTVNSGSWLGLGVDFAENIHLKGVDMPSAQFSPGELAGFSAVWEAVTVEGAATSLPRRDYIVRAELTAPDGTVVARDEHVPVGGSRPTSGWQQGEVITGDAFALTVPADAAPGVYTIWLDLYPNGDPNSRLPVRASAFAGTDGDKVKVVAIRVGAPPTP